MGRPDAAGRSKTGHNGLSTVTRAHSQDSDVDLLYMTSQRASSEQSAAPTQSHLAARMDSRAQPAPKSAPIPDYSHLRWGDRFWRVDDPGSAGRVGGSVTSARTAGKCQQPNQPPQLHVRQQPPCARYSKVAGARARVTGRAAAVRRGRAATQRNASAHAHHAGEVPQDGHPALEAAYFQVSECAHKDLLPFEGQFEARN